MSSAACGDLSGRLPLTKQGKGGTALGITMIAAFFGASFGITEMIFLAPFLVKMALEFGPAEVCSLMLVGLLAGSTLAKGSPLKGIAMTVFGLLVGIVGIDIETGSRASPSASPNCSTASKSSRWRSACSASPSS
jgi:TctA family transporter